MRTEQILKARGALMTRALSGSWRSAPPPLALDIGELDIVAPLAVRAGVGALVWRRLGDEDLRSSPSGRRLQQCYHWQVLNNELHRRSLKKAIEVLSDAGIEGVLVKGWSLADLYPEPGMRPFGDIDLCVRAKDYARAVELFRAPELKALDVDLHRGFSKFYDRREDEFFARAEVLPLDEYGVRVLGAEDRLRFLCLHMLRHGANRALWVCDIAAALEALPAGFDWDLCLGGERRKADWVASAIGIVRDLLGVEVEDAEVARRASRTPLWVREVAAREWGRPFRFRLQIARRLRRPAAALREIRHHWPNAIEATIALNCAFNEWPRWPYQFGYLGARVAVYAAQSLGIIETPQARSRSEKRLHLTS